MAHRLISSSIRAVIDSSEEEDHPVQDKVKIEDVEEDKQDLLHDIPDDIADIVREAEAQLSQATQEEQVSPSKKERSKSQRRKKKFEKKEEDGPKFFDFNDPDGDFDIYGYKKTLQKQKSAAGRKFKTGGVYVYDKSEGTASPLNPGYQKSPSDWGVYKVDSQARLYNCHVFEDYSVTLNQTDVGYGELGHNKFYVMQLMEANGCNKWYTYFKWGRVGAKKPSDSLIKYDSLVEAMRAFQKQFKRKTMNDWSKRRTSFKPHPGKYRIVQVQADQIQVAKRNEKRQKLAILLEQSSNKYKMKVKAAVAQVLFKIFDEKSMERSLKEYNIDLKKCPLGMLSKEQILEGYSILKKILKLLVEGQRTGIKSNLSAILPLSNDFYTMIPHDFGMKRPPPISMYAHVKHKIELLDILMDIHLANASILDELQLLETCHPADFYSQILNSKLQVLSSERPQYQQITRAVETTSVHEYKIKVEQIFSVFRIQEALRFIPFHQVQKKMLWHGSRDTNMAGILTEGLRVAPEQAPKTGYMFGKGIYFSDLASKAANYCRNSPNQTGLLLLCEVGTGTEYKLTKSEFLAQPPNGFLSVKGVGKLAPTKNTPFVNKDEYLVDTVVGGLREENKSEEEIKCIEEMLSIDLKFGKNKATLYDGPVGENEELAEGLSELKYNEYVIYEEAQAKIRYIVHWRKIP